MPLRSHPLNPRLVRGLNRFPSVAYAIAGLLTISFLAGCVMPPPGDDGTEGGEGQVSFFVKDAPSDDFSSVFVTFTQVEVHLAGGEDDEDDEDEDDNATESPSPSTNTTAPSNTTNPTNTTSPTNTTVPTNSTSPTNSTVEADEESDDEDDNETDDEDGSGENRWIVIVNSTQTVDLKAFQGDARMFLGGSDVPAGRYTQIRIHVDRAYGVMNGTEVNITVSSGTLKIVRPWTVEAGAETQLTVDFELDKSIHKTGKGYRLTPVMKLSVDHGPAESEDTETSEPDEGGETDETGERQGPPTNNTHRPTDKGKPE